MASSRLQAVIDYPCRDSLVLYVRTRLRSIFPESHEETISSQRANSRIDTSRKLRQPTRESPGLEFLELLDNIHRSIEDRGLGLVLSAAALVSSDKR